MPVEELQIHVSRLEKALITTLLPPREQYIQATPPVTQLPKNSCKVGIRVNSDCSQSFWHAVITMEDGSLSCAIKVQNLVNLLSLYLYQAKSEAVTSDKHTACQEVRG